MSAWPNRAPVLLNRVSLSSKLRLSLAKKGLCLHQTEPLLESNRASVYVWFYYSYSLCGYVSTLGRLNNKQTQEWLILFQHNSFSISDFSEVENVSIFFLYTSGHWKWFKNKFQLISTRIYHHIVYFWLSTIKTLCSEYSIFSLHISKKIRCLWTKYVYRQLWGFFLREVLKQKERKGNLWLSVLRPVLAHLVRPPHYL